MISREGGHDLRLKMPERAKRLSVLLNKDMFDSLRSTFFHSSCICYDLSKLMLYHVSFVLIISF